MKKILIVDDEDKIREVIREYAEFSGYEAEEAADGMSAIGMVKLNDYDLIIMDIMMPKLDGFSAVKEIQKIKDIPVIMLSARGEEYDKLFGFELGIDDYVVKPFSPKELMARVNAVLNRRDSSDRKVSAIQKFEGLEVNMAARTITVDGKRVDLTPKEYDLLFYMIQNKNIALSREKLLEDIWGYHRHARQEPAQLPRAVPQVHRDTKRRRLQVRVRGLAETDGRPHRQEQDPEGTERTGYQQHQDDDAYIVRRFCAVSGRGPLGSVQLLHEQLLRKTEVTGGHPYRRRS